VLGVIPLGFGCTIPREEVYRIETPTQMPKFFYYLDRKIRSMLMRVGYSSLTWANYLSTGERLETHRCSKSTQYHSLQEIRRQVEAIVEDKLPLGERNPVKIRQYKNAMLQLIAYRVKRHKWGYHVYKSISEEEFKQFWLESWVAQGLNKDTLNYLYEVIKPCLSNLRGLSFELGESIKKEKINLSKVPR